MAAFSKKIPKNNRDAFVGVVVNADFIDSFLDLRVRSAGLADARKVAFHISQENRHARPGKAFGQYL